MINLLGSLAVEIGIDQLIVLFFKIIDFLLFGWIDLIFKAVMH